MVGYIGLRRVGTRGGGLGSSLLTPNLLAAIGLEHTRAEAVHGRVSPGGLGGYREHATDDPELDFCVVDVDAYPTLRLRRGATPKVSYSADLSNSAWTKSGITPIYNASGGCAPGNGWSLATAVANNAYYARQLSATSGPIQSRLRVEAPSGNSGSVYASHGDATGAELKSNHDFATNSLTGWSNNSVGTGTVDASSGDAVLTTVDGSNYADLRGSFTVVAGRLYKITVQSSAGIFFNPTGATRDYAGSYGSGHYYTTTTVFYVKSTTTTASFLLRVASGNSTTTIYSCSCKAVAEAEITPGSFQDMTLPEYTGASPLLLVRVATSGDTVRHYDFQSFSLPAGRPPPRLPPTSSSLTARGAATCGRTISPPATVGMTFLVETPPANASADFVLFTLYESGDTDSRLQVYFDNGSWVLRKNASTDQTIDTGYSEGTLVKIDVEWDGSNIRARADDGSWASVTHETIHAFDRFRLGSNHTPDNHFTAGIVAIEDTARTVLLRNMGFNLEAIAEYNEQLGMSIFSWPDAVDRVVSWISGDDLVRWSPA